MGVSSILLDGFWALGEIPWNGWKLQQAAVYTLEGKGQLRIQTR